MHVFRGSLGLALFSLRAIPQQETSLWYPENHHNSGSSSRGGRQHHAHAAGPLFHCFLLAVRSYIIQQTPPSVWFRQTADSSTHLRVPAVRCRRHRPMHHMHATHTCFSLLSMLWCYLLIVKHPAAAVSLVLLFFFLRIDRRVSWLYNAAR